MNCDFNSNLKPECMVVIALDKDYKAKCTACLWTDGLFNITRSIYKKFCFFITLNNILQFQQNLFDMCLSVISRYSVKVHLKFSCVNLQMHG